MNNKQYERFMSRVYKNPENNCWEWTAGKFFNGYGNFNVCTYKTRGAHRISYIYHNNIKEEDAKGFLVCHHCDNPKCVNPKHLFLGTQFDNMQDMSAKGRGNKLGKSGSDSPKAKLTDDDVFKIVELYNSGKYTNVALGNMFDVYDATIHYIISRKTWRNLNLNIDKKLCEEERLSDRKKDKIKKQIFSSCPKCESSFKPRIGQKYCSTSCASKSLRKVDWPTKEELSEMVGKFPMVKIGKKYGVSDNTVRKWAKNYELI